MKTPFHFLYISSLLTAASISLFFATDAGAAVYNASETLGNFGTLSQLNGSVTAPAGQNAAAFRANACVPTAVTDALIWLNNTFTVPNLIMANRYPTLNSLAGFMGTTTNGTSLSGMANGTLTYIGPSPGQNVSPPVSIVGGQVSGGMTGTTINNRFTTNSPTAFDFFTALTTQQATEFTLSWWTGTNYDGAHELTLTGINYNTASGNGSGTLSFIDPFGGVAITGSITNLGFGIYLTYSGGAAGNAADGDNPGVFSSGVITADMIERVPEPAMVALFVAGGLAFAFVTVRRHRS